MSEDLYDFESLFAERSIEDNINTKLENSLKDRSSTPRVPVYLRDDKLFIYLTGVDVIVFDGRQISISFKTINDIDPLKLSIKTMRLILDKLKNPKQDASQHDEIKEKYRIDSRKVTNRHLKQILKYEQRIEGKW